jgi:hypothetical protein
MDYYKILRKFPQSSVGALENMKNRRTTTVVSNEQKFVCVCVVINNFKYL